MKKNVITLVLFIFLSFSFHGCYGPGGELGGLLPGDSSPWHATLEVYNKTGHDILMSLDGGKLENVKDNGSIGKDFGGHYSSHQYSARVNAYKEELNTEGNVIWSYSYNHDVYLGKGTNIKELRPEMNDFVMPPFNLNMTNKTGVTLGISEGNTSDGIFLTLKNSEPGSVTINQIITDKNNKSFYFFVVNTDSTYGPPLRMTLSARYITSHRISGIDIPAELLTKGVVTY